MITQETRKDLEALYDKIILLKAQIAMESDEYRYYKEIRDAVEMVLDRPVPAKKPVTYSFIP